jgi:hypothetical protein
MSRTWDIAQADRVFSTHQGITRPLVSKSRPIAEISSKVRLAVAIGVTTASAIVSYTPMSFDRFGGTSDLRVVVERSRIPAQRGPEREKRQGVDFARARSPLQLANSFRGVFRPAADIDDSSDDGFVFR